MTLDTPFLVLAAAVGVVALVAWRESVCERRLREIKEELDETRSAAGSALQAVANIVFLMRLTGRYDKDDLAEIERIVYTAVDRTKTTPSVSVTNIQSGGETTVGGDVTGHNKSVSGGE